MKHVMLIYSSAARIFFPEILLIFIMFAAGFLPAQEPLLGDISDGSRTTPVHIMKLIDQDSSTIFPDEQPLMAFSTNYTCNPCHQYNTIKKGWHFNAGDSGAVDGRVGHPWIYGDPGILTQIPVSYRGWEGVFTPEEVGFTGLDVLGTFGRQMAGSARNEIDSTHALEDYWRWQVSGRFEINCLVCHDAERGYESAEHAAQMLRQNFRWSATAPTAWAAVNGTAKDLPDNYDIYFGIVPDQPQKLPPTVTYDSGRFNAKNQVFMDITRKIDPDRCYFCHSVKIQDPQRDERWHYDEDVHLKAGLTCVDCHRHGLDHRMVRGYESGGESAPDAFEVTLSCTGCHLGTEGTERINARGRYGAPYPLHPGIPTVHFDKMTCTACHSGPWPQDTTVTVKTSMAHGLGLHNVNKGERVLPHIQTPVYVKNENGIIEPRNLIWPSYWACYSGGTYRPLSLKEDMPLVRELIYHIDSLGTGDWPEVSDSLMCVLLDTLHRVSNSDERIVYVSSGYRFELSAPGTITRIKDASLQPYTWPLAHDVRPVMQSLGINGCGDCHGTASAMYFGKVLRDSHLLAAQEGTLSQAGFMKKNRFAAWVFSFSFYFRPLLKFIILGCVLFIALALVYGGMRGFSTLIAYLSGETNQQETKHV